MQDSQKLFFRDMFREARAAALKDAEGFRTLVHALERLGAFLTGRIASLGEYRAEILALLEASALEPDAPLRELALHSDSATLYDLIKEERNAALHEGAYARHLTAHLTRLAVTIEHALTVDMARISDFTIQQPVTAQAWQPISFVRQTMLANSFSYLPIRLSNSPNGWWYVVSDYSVALFLRASSTKTEYRNRLSMAIGAAIEQGGIPRQKGFICKPDEGVSQALAASNGMPILVVRETEELLGIATPFDLL